MTRQKKTTNPINPEAARKRELALIDAGRAFQSGLEITERVNTQPVVLLRDSELDALRCAIWVGKKYRELIDFTLPNNRVVSPFMGAIYKNMITTLDFYSSRKTFERAVEHFRGLKLSPRIFDQDSPYREQLKQARIKRKKQDYR